MKKFFAMILALALAFSMSTVAFAAEGTETLTGSGDSFSGSKVNNVTVNVTTAGTVYSVDIKWENLEFTYAISAGVWSPETHTYDGQAGWSHDSASVTVTNHSNAAVSYEISYTGGEQVDNVNVAFTGATNAPQTLATAEGTPVNSAPSASCSVSVSGTPTAATITPVTVGTITITVGRA